MLRTSRLRPRLRPSLQTRTRLQLRSLESRAVPAAFTVNSLADAGVGIGTAGDLRYCITQANDEFTFPGEDTISFSVNGTVTLGGTELQVFAPLTINGPGADKVTVNGNAASRIFFVDDGGVGKINFTVTGLTLTNGKVDGSGGAIFLQDETLTIRDCAVTSNEAVAVTGKGRGAGIYSFGYSDMTIQRCTISGNKAAGNGGGVYNAYAVVMLLENSTISGNTSGSRGGGVCIRYWRIPTGGVPSPSFTMNNCTVTNNSAANTASTGGGGGIHTSIASSPTPGPALNINSSIISGNSNSVAPDIRTNGVNAVACAIGTKTGIGVFTPDATTTSLLGATLNLGALANNGGTTQTQLPAGGSVLRNNGSNPAGLTTDQRGAGFPRTLDGKTDIGAVESSDPTPQRNLVPVPPIAVPGGAPTSVSVTYSDNTAIDVSTIDVNDITITAPDGLTKLPIIGSSVDINTNGTPRVATYTFVIPGGSWDSTDAGIYTVSIVAGQVFDLDAPTPNSALPGPIGTFAVTIPSTLVVNATNDEATDTDGKTSLREALAVANKALGAPDTITFDPTVFASQKTILMTLGEFKVSDAVTIVGPAARVVLDAGGLSRVLSIAVAGSSSNVVSLSNLVVTGGKTVGVGSVVNNRGGGVFIEDEAVTFKNCVITNNFTESVGGGIYQLGATFPADPGLLTILDSEVSGNTSLAPATSARNGAGGGVAVDLAGKLVMQRTTVANNSANRSGGGVYFVVSGSCDISNSTITGNSAAGVFGGGGFYFYGTVVAGLKITNTTISGNQAPNGVGGGIALDTFNNLSQLQVANCTITGNSAVSGGGISVAVAAYVTPLTLNSTIVAGNTATGLTGADVNIDIPTAVTGNNNLIGVADDTAGNVTFTGSGNLTGTSATPLDAQLDSLASNGGPTQTHALKAGSPAINTGNNALSLTTDQRGFGRVVGGTADIGAYEFGATAATPPTVTSVKVNGAGVQRSMVTSLVVTFSEAVSFPSGVGAAFQLSRIGQPSGGPSAAAPLGTVNLNAVQAGSQVTITFLAGGVVGVDPGSSLIDGLYQLTIDASKVTGVGGNLDGNGNGTGGDNFQTPAAGSGRITRLFGDSDGDGDVDAIDFGGFRGAFGSANPTFDYDADADVDSIDFGQFRQRFGVVV